MASAAVAWWPLVLAWWATRACLGSAAAAQAAAAQAAAAPAAQPQAATADIFSRIRGGNSEVAAQPLTLRPLHVHAWDLDRDIARAPARTSAAAATAEELLEARGVEAGPDEAAGVVAAILLELAERGQRAHANFHLVPVLSHATPEDEWQGRTGLVHEAMLADFPDLSGHDVYVCGSVKMVEAAVPAFIAQGLSEEVCFSDAFVPSASRAAKA